MLRSCKHCGRIHDTKIDCGKKPKYITQKTATKMDKFRKTRVWTNKSIEIRERDKHMCQICKTGKYFTDTRYNYSDLSVHHIIPLHYDFDKRLDNDNLITLCSYHHELAERGKIPAIELQSLIQDDTSEITWIV